MTLNWGNPIVSAWDGQGGVAGAPEPDPNKSTVDAVSDNHGLGLKRGEEAHLKEKLDRRDERRWELNRSSSFNS